MPVPLQALVAAVAVVEAIWVVYLVVENRRANRTVDLLNILTGNSKAAADREQRLVRQAFTPLKWAWDLLGDEAFSSSPTARWLRVYLASVIGTLQDALAAEDATVAEWLEKVPEPPRRLPKYPQIPPYLARPEDVVGGTAASAVAEAEPVDLPRELAEAVNPAVLRRLGSVFDAVAKIAGGLVTAFGGMEKFVEAARRADEVKLKVDAVGYDGRVVIEEAVRVSTETAVPFLTALEVCWQAVAKEADSGLQVVKAVGITLDVPAATKAIIEKHLRARGLTEGTR